MARARASAAAELLAWYDRHRRALPWRAPPGARADPYRVWLSEVMLQQTRVAAVVPYFERFLARWPTVAALAKTPRAAVLRAWAGLGYYARARNLHKCAQQVVARHGGAFPADERALRALPGIGPYTAGAIAAIAFDLPVAAVDGNAERVIARLFAVATPLPAAKPELRRLAQSLVPEERAGDYAQAVMDLGATVCTASAPRCGACPWSAHCQARAQGLAAELPRRAAQRTRPTRRGVAFWIERADGAVLLRRRPDSGLLGGMVELPSTEWAEAAPAPEDAAAAPPVPISDWRLLPGVVRHGFTHFHLELAVLAARAAEPAPAGFWCAPAALYRQGLPTVMRKVAAHARSARRPPR